MLTAALRTRLSLVMFLEFFVWGAWFVTLGTYLATDLQASGNRISLAFLPRSLGVIVAPLAAGAALLFAALFREREAPDVSVEVAA